MRIVKGNKELQLTQEEFLAIKDSYESVVIDLGTGDGRFVYTKAKENPKTLVIGIDPSHKQLETYSKKANKERLENVLFVVAAVENLPIELSRMGNEVFINFPWGSLLGGIAQSEKNVIEAISGLVAPEGTLQIIFGFSQDAEPSETERLGLGNLSVETIKNAIIPTFGMDLVSIEELTKEQTFGIQSSWGKKLSFGQDRPIFRLILKR